MRMVRRGLRGSSATIPEETPSVPAPSPKEANVPEEIVLPSISSSRSSSWVLGSAYGPLYPPSDIRHPHHPQHRYPPHLLLDDALMRPPPDPRNISRTSSWSSIVREFPYYTTPSAIDLEIERLHKINEESSRRWRARRAFLDEEEAAAAAPRPKKPWYRRVLHSLNCFR